MSSRGLFNAIFGVEDRASEKLAVIRANTQRLNQVALSTAKNLREIGSDLGDAGTTGQDKGIGKAAAEARALSSALDEMGKSGQFSSSKLRQLSREVAFLSEVTQRLHKRGSAELAKSLRLVSNELASTSANMVIAEQESTKVASAFTFMGDAVSYTHLTLPTIYSV